MIVISVKKSFRLFSERTKHNLLRRMWIIKPLLNSWKMYKTQDLSSVLVHVFFQALCRLCPLSIFSCGVEWLSCRDSPQVSLDDMLWGALGPSPRSTVSMQAKEPECRQKMKRTRNKITHLQLFTSSLDFRFFKAAGNELVNEWVSNPIHSVSVDMEIWKSLSLRPPASPAALNDYEDCQTTKFIIKQQKKETVISFHSCFWVLKTLTKGSCIKTSASNIFKKANI